MLNELLIDTRPLDPQLILERQDLIMGRSHADCVALLFFYEMCFDGTMSSNSPDVIGVAEWQSHRAFPKAMDAPFWLIGMWHTNSANHKT